MLSFMREERVGDSSVQKPSGAAAGRSPADGTKEAQEQEYLTVAARGKDVRKSTTLLVVLFGMGLLCLWFMIRKSTPQAASAKVVDTGETQIEMAISRLTGVRSEMFSRLDEIVKKFYRFSDVQQVEVNELVKNPFKLEIFLGDLKELSGTEESDLDTDVMRQQQIRQQAKNMQLLSIMQSAQGSCCMIDDEILYEGNSIKGFNVLQINDSFVKLESEGVEISLKLSE